MPGTMGGTFMGGEMMWMLLGPLLLIGLLALAFAWAVRADRATSGAAADAPLTILQRRYARGDVGADEYGRIRAAVTAD